MGRLTRRIGDEIIDVSTEYFNLSHQELVHELFNRLAEYEDMEENKQLFKFPCKVGDIVYRITEFNGNQYIVEGIVTTTTLKDDKFYFHLKHKQLCEYCKDCEIYGDYHDEHTNDLENGYCFIEWGGGEDKHFGKSVFNTREEAARFLIS